ncbi:cilia- and flagella-associated protein 157-like isoform X1 [Physella acuta]|uniref:cilia- and flagella-associated protein 157-like isoform X1 n=1 Tax=Physella acuta TaxID=109671 RepID=UPI0027DB2BE8|nr:cilia- and flagella-associated protein 157-like isoform X1 [Physella acuta]
MSIPNDSKKGSLASSKGAPESIGNPFHKPPKVEPESKEVYLKTITNLEIRVKKYQKRCDELEVANGQYQEKYDQMSSDKKEIVSFWKKQVEIKTDEIVDLNERLIGLQQLRDNERETFKKQIQEQRTEFQEMKDQLTAENMILGGKLASLEEFKLQKEELMNKFAMMEAELSRREDEYQDKLYALEKKAVIDKDRLKKEMILRVNQVAAEFRKISNKQMAETTKRTIRENVSITSQLAKMSDKTIELIKENDSLEEKVKKLKQQVELLEANEKELGKKNQSNMKIIKFMTEKCQSQEETIAEYAKKEENYVEVESDIELLKQEVDKYSTELQVATRDNNVYEEMVQKLEEENHKERKLRTKIEDILAKASIAIKNVLIEDPDASPDDRIEDLYKREYLLENLLVLMNSAANLGIGAQISDLGKTNSEATPVVLPGPSKPITKKDFPEIKGSLPHYSLGDLGLIPRPNQQIPTSLDKIKVSSKQNKLGTLRGVLSKSVATQTSSGANTILYAAQYFGAPSMNEMKQSSAGKPSGLSPLPVPKKIVESMA